MLKDSSMKIASSSSDIKITCYGDIDLRKEYANASRLLAEFRYPEALIATQDILRKLEGFRGALHPEMIKCKNVLAKILLSLNRLEECLAVVKEVKEKAEECLSHTHPTTIAAKIHHAGVLWQLERLPEALEAYGAILQLLDHKDAANFGDILSINNSIATILVILEKFDEGLELYWKLLKQEEELAGPMHPEVIQRKIQIIVTFYKKGEWYTSGVMAEQVLHSLRQSNNLLTDYWEEVCFINNIYILCLHKFHQARSEAVIGVGGGVGGGASEDGSKAGTAPGIRPESANDFSTAPSSIKGQGCQKRGRFPDSATDPRGLNNCVGKMMDQLRLS